MGYGYNPYIYLTNGISNTCTLDFSPIEEPYDMQLGPAEWKSNGHVLLQPSPLATNHLSRF